MAEELGELSGSVWKSAREAAFALMLANSSEQTPSRDAPGRRQGPDRETRDLAIRLRDSIWYRFDALRFHHEVMLKVHAGYLEALVKAGPLAAGDRENFDLAFGAVQREQALFDDVVFHTISLFDYMGNAVWFGFHGRNHVKKKWKNASRAARDESFEAGKSRGEARIYGSATGDVISSLDRQFVNRLSEYRAMLYHYHRDSAGGGVTHKFTSIPGGQGRSTWQPQLHIKLPKDYAARVKTLIQAGADPNDDMLLHDGAEALIRKVGTATIELLDTLTADLGWDKDAGLVIV